MGGDGRLLCEDRRALTAREDTPATLNADEPIGESRWPPVLVLVGFLAINIAFRLWIHEPSPVRIPWLVPAVEVLLIALLLVSNLGNVTRHRRVLRRVAVVLVVALVCAALWATALLIYDLVEGSGVTQSARRLLATGAVIWVGNNIAFALLYWLIDGGGPVARSRLAVPVDFAFTQHLSPELSPPRWRPVFLDYLHLGFTNATAFSPTDVMPLSHRAKYTMLVQASLALALFGLIVARAVNAFT